MKGMKTRYPHSYFVRCLNCGILWERITVPATATYTVDNNDIQHNCPNCSSNAYKIKGGHDGAESPEWEADSSGVSFWG